ncbi:ankyrin repeat domain-containing protein 31 isoform X11 [Rhineura floridana]|uniref:ankyrin repeat domain-containing protein 31 isoform X11 n=1 Tax=Rhineura floridana TaxID=261503 RepID=UPI002AC893B2|nr:ankyrin repeat domain-containing protein 31 isoform X11 [Rhineura floridana]
MEEGSAISDADSDETIVEGSVAESDLEEEEHRGQRLSLLCKNITLATENGIAAEIGNISEEKLSPEIEFICKHSINLQIPGLTDLINLLNQERNKMVGSQSLLQAGINCPVIAMDICQLDCPRAATAHGEDEHFICLDSEVPGFPETSDRNFPEPLNDEDSPEISLLSGMDVIKAPSNNSILQRTEMSEIFQSVNKEDMTENTLETMTSSITSNKIMAVKSEDLMEPLSDSETLQMLDMLEYQNDAIPTDTSVNKESNALPVELLTALNSLSESVAASLCLPADKGSRYITTEKEPTPDQTEDGCTQITDTHLKPQLLLKHLEGIEALTMTTLPHPSEEQIDCNQNMHQLNCSDHQNMSSHDTPAKKANSILNNASSHEQTVNVTSYTKRKSARKRKEFTLNDVDAASNCHQFLEGMQQKIHSYETRTRTSAKVFDRSNIQDKANECSQMGTGSCHFSSEDVNTKVEQVRKSQRIAKKRRQATSKNCSNDSSRNYISLSKINRRDIFGQTLLHRAAMKGDLDDICAMIKAGANVNAQDYAGWTPLHEASVAGFFEATNEFLKAGAGVNCKGSEQVTPLHDAVKEGHYKVAELLLWYGADPLLKNERGKSPLEEAAADRHMRKLLESCIAKSRRSASAERLVESPSSDQSRMESHPKVKRSSGESIQHSTVEKTKILKQHSVKLEQNKKKGTPQSNFASRLHNRCSPLNATTFEGTCLASKAKQSVREGPPSFWGTSSDKRRINGQRKGIHDGLSNSLSFPEGIVGSSGYNQYNSNRTCDTGEECSMAVGSEIQQESDFNNSDNDCLSERKEPLKSSELAGTTKDQVTNSCVVTSLNLVDKSTLPSETEIVNEPNIDFTHLLCKDIRLPLQEERQCAMKPSSGSPCFKVGTLGDNLHTNEMMLVWTVREAINPAYNKNRPPVQYLHSESSVDQVNLDCHRNVVLEHELSVKEPVTEPIYLEENPLEAKSTTTTLMQEIAHLSDSDYTVLSGEYTLNADQNSDTNTFRAAGICHEQTVHVSIEISSTFSQGINRVDVSESPDTYSVSEQRFLTPPVHEGIMMGPRTEGNVGRCCLERTENGGRMDNNTFLPLQMLDKNPFQDKSLQTEILGRCYSEKSEKENSNIIPLQVNELETIQSKIMEAGRELCNSRSRKIHSCCDCSEKDNSVSQPNSSRQSCDTHESINELLHDIEDKQDRLLLFELRSQRDADLYIQDLSQIQNILNALLAKQKSERDALAKKYSQNSEKQLNFKANRREKNQLLHLLELGKIKPGDDVLEFTLQDSKHKASLLGNGKVKTGNNSVYQNLVQWIKALLGNDISVNWKYAYSKVTYSGTLLSKIIAEVHVSKELELQQKKLFGRNSTGCDYSRGVAELCCCSHKTSSSQDVDNIQQKVAPFSQEMEILPSSETEADEIMPEVSEIKASYHFNSSARPRRFLQFNSRALIKDEEFMPGHIMDQYWNFYVHCKNFGF